MALGSIASTRSTGKAALSRSGNQSSLRAFRSSLHRLLRSLASGGSPNDCDWCEQCSGFPLCAGYHLVKLSGTVRCTCRAGTGREERESFAGLSVTGWKLRERLAMPVAEIRDVKTSRSRPLSVEPGEPL
jgi:hypothetical protein